MASIGSIVIQFAADTAKATRDVGKVTHALGEVDKKARTAGGGMSKWAKAAAGGVAAVAAVGAAAVTSFVGFAEAAIEDADAANKLAKNLKKAAGATDAQVDSVEDWITQMGIAKGVADDKLRPALSRLVRSTKNVAEAQELATLAMDLSAATGKDYNTVAAALAKANDGQIGALKKLGVTLGDQAANAIDFQKAQSELSTALANANLRLEENGPKSKEYLAAQEKVAAAHKKVNALIEAGVDWQGELGKAYQGSADAAAGTIKGTWERIKLIFSELGEAIGSAALPPLEAFASWFKDPKHVKDVQGWIDKVGEWAKSVGEGLLDKVQEFVDYLQSPEGQKAIADFTNKLASIRDAFAEIIDKVQTLIGWIESLTTAWDNLPDWAKPDTAVDAVGDKKKKAAAAEKARQDELARRRAAGLGPKKSTVNVTINNPKPEKASTSIAAAQRVARWNSESW